MGDAERQIEQPHDEQPPETQVNLAAIASIVRTVAQQHQGESMELLALLRLLESLHQEIRDGLFQPSLPDNRQALYALLRDIEAQGGWPYIHRMKLNALLANLPQEWLDESLDGNSSH